MKLGAYLGYWGLGLTPQEQLGIVQEAERLGYDSAWAAEAYGSDAALRACWRGSPLRPLVSASAQGSSPSCAWRSRVSASTSTARPSSSRFPHGPGKALKLTISPVQERIPIYLAAIGPKNIALAGEIADGWFPCCSRPSTSPSCARCCRKAPSAPDERSRGSTSPRP